MEPETMVGRTVVGRFRIERIIGRGGMACVYAAFDERSGREVALKLLKRELTRDPTVLRRFEREAKAAAHLLHPNIIEVYESGIQDEDAFIAMELANGKDLLKALSQQRPMRQTRAALVLAQVCAALDVAHGKGIVHRDLKPENIVLVPDPAEPGGERAKVLDFGIAKILDVSKPGSGDSTDPPSYVTKTALTRVGTIVGTPAYMSPEQCRGGDLDGRSDIYTCGVLLYQLVTGELPFTGETPLHTAMRHIHAQPRPPHELRRDIHPSLERIILKALAKWPGERHQTAIQLRDELAACIPDLPDRGDVSLPPEYFSARPRPAAAPPPPPPPAPEPEAPPDSDPVQPTRMLVGGPLGRTPLRAVRLGGPSSTPTPQATKPAEPAPSPEPPPAPIAEATPAAAPARAPKPPDSLAPAPSGPATMPQLPDDDDEPRTFLMKPDDHPAVAGQAASAPPPKTEPKGGRAEPPSPAAAAPMTAAPATPVKGSARTAPGSPRPTNSAMAHAKTAPAAGPIVPTGISRPPARPEKSSRPPVAARPAARAPEPPSRDAHKPVPSRPTETGLTPTNVTHVPSSNDPPTQKKAADAPALAPRHADPLAQTVSPSVAHTPRAAVDDDEVSTGVRDPGAPERQRGANQTLVMEEPSRDGGPPASAHQVHARRGPEMAAAPTLLANQNAPTGAEIEAEALRALKATARMAVDDANSPATPGRSATLRMNQQQQQQERYSSPPASVQVNPAYAGAAQAMPPSSGIPNLAPPISGHGGWNEATVSRRRPELGRPVVPKGGIVGELASLPGTTGFLIGIGLGLGIAAGVVIALLVMR